MPPDSSSSHNLTRRRLLQALAGFGAAGAAAIVGWRWRSSVRRDARMPDAAADQTRVLEVVAAFAGACFGHQLSASEITEVVIPLRAVLAIDPPLAARFPVVAEFADRAARHHGAASFLASTLDVRNAVVEDLMATPVTSKRSQLLAQLSRRERSRRIVRGEVMQRLPRMYAGSAPAWRRRGYTRWPGVGGDPREYTRAGSDQAC